ncbi:MAG: hypothetical protein IKD47_06240 [Clostridia bacterium]|nr:hypothetical protein [Clostridia bacterium]
MEIDIISYTDAQYAALSEEQILEVKAAQMKKNRLAAKLSEDMQREKHRLVSAGIYFSPIWGLVQAKLQAAYDAEVENVRESLLFYLRFSGKPSEEETENAPYDVDYSLSDTERYTQVKTYYERTYTDGAKRFAAFKADTVAKRYLGELYATLYDYFLESA